MHTYTVTSHYITSHHITLHYITLIHTCMHACVHTCGIHKTAITTQWKQTAFDNDSKVPGPWPWVLLCRRFEGVTTQSPGAGASCSASKSPIASYLHWTRLALRPSGLKNCRPLHEYVDTYMWWSKNAHANIYMVSCRLRSYHSVWDSKQLPSSRIRP